MGVQAVVGRIGVGAVRASGYGTRRPGVVALGVVVGVLVAATGLFIVLFFVEWGDVGAGDRQLAEVERALRVSSAQLESELSAVAELEREERELASEHDALSTCAESASTAIDVAERGDAAALAEEVDEMILECGR